MNPYQRVLRRLGTQRWFARFGARILTPLDRRLAGRRFSITTLGTDFPMGYLTTAGRQTGKDRTVPLLYVDRPDGTAAVVGTNFGQEDHPAWTGNLERDPRATWAAPDRSAVVARAATEIEFNELWPRFVAMWPGYESYVARSGRSPKMFILESA